MTALTIRNIEPAIKDKLRLAAAAHGRSMEEEVRTISRNALANPEPQTGLGSRLQARFKAVGAVELALPVRTDLPRALHLEGGDVA